VAGYIGNDASSSAILRDASFLTLVAEPSLPNSKRLQGTADQVILTVAAGDLVLSTPQDIDIAATPQFAGLTLTGSLAFSPDNSVDLTAVGSRPRSGYFGTSVAIGASPAAGGALRLATGTSVGWTTSGTDWVGLRIVTTTIDFSGGSVYPSAFEFWTASSTGLSIAGGGVVSASGALVVGTSPAATGAVRIANNSSIIWRNAANDGDRVVLTHDASNVTILSNITGGAVRIANSSSGAFSVFGVTPVGQGATIADADGTLADVTTKFNTLLARLEGWGWNASS